MGQRNDKVPPPNFEGRSLAEVQRRDNPRYRVDAYEKEGIVRDLSAPIEEDLDSPQKDERSSDVRIKEEICERLETAPYSGDSELEVEVKNGNVRLQGVVLEDYMKGVIQNIVESVDGVKTFLDEVRVAALRRDPTP